MNEADLPPESPPPGPLMRIISDQRVAFMAVGVVNTVIGLSTFVLLSETLGPPVEARFGKVAAALVAVSIAHVISVLSAFVLHRRFVFRVQGHLLRDLARFWSVYVVAGAWNLATLPVLVEMGLARIPAQLVITASIMLFTYFSHRHFSFRRKPFRRSAAGDQEEASRT